MWRVVAWWPCAAGLCAEPEAPPATSLACPARPATWCRTQGALARSAAWNRNARAVLSAMVARMPRFHLMVAVCSLGCLMGCGDTETESRAQPPSAQSSDAGAAMYDDAAQRAASGGDGVTPTQVAPFEPDPPGSQIVTTSSGARPAPTNTSFDTAHRTVPGSQPWLQDVVGSAQVDYFVFAGEAGGYYEITTDENDFSPDNITTLYDSQHNVIAKNDVGSIWPGDGIDTRLVVRLPTTGDYYVRVEDPALAQAYFDDPSFVVCYYHFSVRELTDGDGIAVAQPGVAASVHFRRDESLGYLVATLVGDLADSAGPDTFAFEGRADNALIGETKGVTLAGDPPANARIQLSVVDLADQVLAHSGPGLDINPPISAGEYRLRVEPSGPLGSNTFYAVDIVLIPDNPGEQSDAENSELNGAQELNLTGSFSRRSRILARLPASDVDYYKFEASADQSVGVSCQGESGGSGVRGLTAELRDSADQTLAKAVEASPDPLKIDPVQVSESATYYVRLSSMTPASPEAEPWARCVITVWP